jgi:hypothetical protein
MQRPAPALALSDGQKSELQALVRNGNTPQRTALRCRLLLLAHQGIANQTIAERLNLSRPTVLAVRSAFAKRGMTTSSSWLNQVERFFALITGRMIRRGTFRSTVELERAIYEWLATWNGDPTPFVWKASADVILHKVQRCKELRETGD